MLAPPGVFPGGQAGPPGFFLRIALVRALIAYVEILLADGGNAVRGGAGEGFELSDPSDWADRIAFRTFCGLGSSTRSNRRGPQF